MHKSSFMKHTRTQEYTDELEWPLTLFGMQKICQESIFDKIL